MLCHVSEAFDEMTIFGFKEEQLHANRKYVWFFAYNLRMERGIGLILTWALCLDVVLVGHVCIVVAAGFFYLSSPSGLTVQ